MSQKLQERIERAGPKRILSLDGGGIRGLITLGMLQKIEAILAERYGTGEAFRLRDHYDLIGGTSTGAIIAAGLAIGQSVAELEQSYKALGKKIFGKSRFLGRISSGALAPKFNAQDVDDVLKSILGDMRLGDPALETGLCIVAKRFDTNSAWSMVNAPKSKYYDHATQPNREFILRSIVRASTAAPSYFDPELITLGPATYGFIDGGISMHNNPALKLLLVATAPGFGFNWKTGVDNLSILSLGTGDWPRVLPINPEGLAAIPLGQVANLLGMMMEDASALDETILQAIGQGQSRRDIDRVIGRLDGGTLWGEPKLRYERFQVELTETFMKANGLDAHIPNIDAYRQMDNIEFMDQLYDMGFELGAHSIEPAGVV